MLAEKISDNPIVSIEEAIEEARNGHLIILVDDENRENEGDLFIPAQMATPEIINFMASYGKGLICLSLTEKRVHELELPLMARQNQSRHQTAFTVSIESKEGITTGISAPDRAQTVSVAIDPAKTRSDIATPGHIFPLVARDGGVLVRAGHTEAAVDIARLAGLNPSGVICEIMKNDGTMARLNDLIEFSIHHKVKIAKIADLIAYRRQYDRLVEKVVTENFSSYYGGDFKIMTYVSKINPGLEHIALVKGDITSGEPVMVRMHALNILNDVLGDLNAGKGQTLQKSMKMVKEEGRGVIVLLRETLPNVLSDKLKDSRPLPDQSELRDYGVGAQILIDLGVKEMILLSNSQPTIVGLEGYGLKVVERRAIK